MEEEVKRIRKERHAEAVVAEEEAVRNQCQKIAGLLKIRRGILIIRNLIYSDVGIGVVFLQGADAYGRGALSPFHQERFAPELEAGER